MEKLVKDNAICLCGTCHSMVEARHFKENINLFIPQQTERQEQKADPKLKLKFDNECLDFCLKYRNGMTFRKIGEFNGDLEAQSVIHRVRRGLGILLKEYARTHKEVQT